MEHRDVVALIKKWLESKYIKGVGGAITYADVEVSVYDPLAQVLKQTLQVECKGTSDDNDRAVGQCLRYYVEMKGLTTYLAVPSDYRYLQDVERVIKELNLPIGILIVDNHGEVSVLKQASEHIVESRI